MKKLMFQKELTLIKQRSQKNLCFVIFDIEKILVLRFSHMHVMDDMIYQWFMI